MRGIGRLKVAAALVVFALGAASLVARISSTPASTSSSSTSSASSTGTTPVDPCTLLTKAEAEAALRTPVSIIENPGQCTFVSADLSGRSVAVATPSGLPGPEYLEPAMQQLASAVKGELRPALAGDEAYLVLAKDMSELMGVKAGSYVAVVLTLNKDTPDVQAATLTDLAVKAFSRL